MGMIGAVVVYLRGSSSNTNNYDSLYYISLPQTGLPRQRVPLRKGSCEKKKQSNETKTPGLRKKTRKKSCTRRQTKFSSGHHLQPSYQIPDFQFQAFWTSEALRPSIPTLSTLRFRQPPPINPPTPKSPSLPLLRTYPLIPGHKTGNFRLR